MKSNNIRLTVMSAVCIIAFISSTNALSQTRQSRGFSQSQNQGGASVSDKNANAMQDIEMMREMIRERREQQQQQRQMLMELQEAVSQASGGGQPEPQYQQQSSTRHTRHQQASTPSHYPEDRVTSGSVLSRLDAQDRSDKAELEKKFNMEIQVAQREIDLLKKQLEIANRQLNQCQTGSVNYNTSASFYQESTPVSATPQQRTLPNRAVAKKTAKKEKPTNQQRQKQAPTVKPQPQQNNANKQALEEIEMMRQMLQERREQQAEQMKVLKDLQQAVGQ